MSLKAFMKPAANYAGAALSPGGSIDPQLLSILQSGQGVNAGGTLYAPISLNHYGEDAGIPAQTLGYGAYDPNNMQPGASYGLYGTGGDYAGQYQVENGGSVGDLLKTTVGDLKTPAAMIAAMYLGGQGLGALTGAGSASGAAGAAIDPSLAVQGNSINALDAATGVGYGSDAVALTAPNTAVMGAGAGAGSGVGGTGLDFSTGFTDTGTAGGALDTGYAGSGALTGATGAVAPTSSILDSIKSSGLLGPAATSGAGALGSAASALGGSPSSMLGLGAAALGALAGTQGVKTTQSAQLPSYLQGPVANDLIPRAQGLLASQAPQAQAAGQQMMNVGGGLLGEPIAGNGVGQVHLNAPTTPTNPYLSGMADDIAHRTQLMLGQNNAAIQGNFVGSGGLGGSRQGVAQGVAAGQAADYLQGNLANLYGTQYSNDQNRALQQYQSDQNFYTSQRGQDQSGAGVGAGLVSQGLSTGWQPIQSAANSYSPFTGFGTTTQQQGGGALGALGGALGGAQLAKLWSGNQNGASSTSGSWWG